MREITINQSSGKNSNNIIASLESNKTHLKKTSMFLFHILSCKIENNKLLKKHRALSRTPVISPVKRRKVE